MKQQIYSPIDCNFHDFLLSLATLKKYCKIQYFTETHEFITLNSIIKDVFTTAEKEEFVLLLEDEKIRLDRLVSLDGVFSPKYAHIQDFSCDC
ncbi:MAG: hypothetical protein EAZ20_07495 [Bacteroidetes bacterium]|nr:MAG: hypothetical protein EAZ20_07495 [Bacteroidota bacterium]